MSSNAIQTFLGNLMALPKTFLESTIRHDAPTSDRTRSQTVFSNFFLHIHATRVFPRTLHPYATWGLGVALVSQFIILTVTGILLMVYYKPSVELAYDSIKDLHYVVPTGRFLRNIHRWAAHLMVFTVILHMARVFYTASYKAPREFNWVLGMVLFVLTLMFSFTGYLLPWDQLAYWAITIGANIAASPNELVASLGLPSMFNVGDLQRELLLGATGVGQEALTRFYLLHVMVLPVVFLMILGVHLWRVRKDGGLARPDGAVTVAGKGAGAVNPELRPPAAEPTKSYGLMAVVRDKSPYTRLVLDQTLPSWPYLLRAELVVFMITMLFCVALGLFFDAPLKEMASPDIPENPAKAPWYFLGLQEIVSYSAFVGGILIPGIAVCGLALIPYLDREQEPGGVWFSGRQGKRVLAGSILFAAVAAMAAVAVPVRYGWLRNWLPDIPQLFIIAINPGSLLSLAYVIWSLWIIRRFNSTRMGAIALFTCFLVGFAILTYVGVSLRGPNWGFYWSQASWPVH